MGNPYETEENDVKVIRPIIEEHPEFRFIDVHLRDSLVGLHSCLMQGDIERGEAIIQHIDNDLRRIGL